MKTTTALFIALMSTTALAAPRVGDITKCSPALEPLKKALDCRLFGLNQTSLYDAETNIVLVEANNTITKMEFPKARIAHKLSLQGNHYGIDEAFYNNETGDWVVYKNTYDIEYTVSIIGKDQLEGSGPIIELASRTNKIHLNTSFDNNRIFVQSDDKKTTLEVLRDTRPIAEMIKEGMDIYLYEKRFPEVSFYDLTVEWYNKCKLDQKCLEKAQKESMKVLSKQYKKAGNKEAAESIKNANTAYYFNQFKELKDGCVFNPKTCGGIIGDNADAYYRVNHNLDTGNKALSYNQYEPGGFSILYNYIPLKPTVIQVK
jgi:hypothetical protein